MKRNVISLGLIGAFLFTIALAASPQLHERIHRDANSTDHTCAVTLIASGNYQHSVPAPLVSAPSAAVDLTIVLALTPRWVPSPFLRASVFEHAPPANS